MARRLGRGLGSLLNQDQHPSPVDLPGPSEGEITQAGVGAAGAQIPLDQIRPNSYQPRKHFDSEALTELADSIRAHGVLQPPVVRRGGGAGYELIAGERRWRAAKLAGLQKIPVIIREEVTDDQMLELALVENVQRQDLDPMEKAEGYRDLMERLGLTQDEVAKKVGLKRSTVTNHLRLMELPREAQQALRQSLISMGHARALLGLSKPMEILNLVQRIAREGLSVRQVEQLVRSHKAPPVAAAPPQAPSATNAAAPPWQRELEARMREHLGCKVQLRNGPDFRGDVVIAYYDRADLDRLCDILAPRKKL